MVDETFCQAGAVLPRTINSGTTWSWVGAESSPAARRLAIATIRLAISGTGWRIVVRPAPIVAIGLSS